MRSKLARFLGVMAVLGGCGLLALAQNPVLVASINKQADDVARKDWKELSSQGETLARTHDLLHVMELFRLRRLGGGNIGLGVGKVPGVITPDGIEAKLINLKRNLMPLPKLQKEAADLIRMSEITAAIASVAVHKYPGDRHQDPTKVPVEWKRQFEEMYRASKGLRQAVQEQKPDLVRDSARKVFATCVECHTVYRDAPGSE